MLPSNPTTNNTKTKTHNPRPTSRSCRRRTRSPAFLAAVAVSVVLQLLQCSLVRGNDDDDDYAIAAGHRSLVVALGCFWCAEQAFEQYAPGVVEAVSGYTGGTNQNPTYRNHPGHYEVILIEYDPTKTSYEVLVNYAYRNMDPFDGTGQFCDKGSSYYPAIFYATEEERLVAEGVLDTILQQPQYQDWEQADIAAPILPRPKFWTAEDYHQDYYLKNPSNYGFYKNGCRRPQRLKEVWGEDAYKCYHEEAHTCFVTADTTTLDDDGFGGDDDDVNNNNATATASSSSSSSLDDNDNDKDCCQQILQITNEYGELVTAESNIKGADEEKAGILPTWATILILVVITILVLVCSTYLGLKLSERHKEQEQQQQQHRESEIAIASAKEAAIAEAPKKEEEEEDAV